MGTIRCEIVLSLWFSGISRVSPKNTSDCEMSFHVSNPISDWFIFRVLCIALPVREDYSRITSSAINPQNPDRNPSPKDWLWKTILKRSMQKHVRKRRDLFSESRLTCQSSFVLPLSEDSVKSPNSELDCSNPEPDDLIRMFSSQSLDPHCFYLVQEY